MFTDIPRLGDSTQEPADADIELVEAMMEDFTDAMQQRPDLARRAWSQDKMPLDTPLQPPFSASLLEARAARCLVIAIQVDREFNGPWRWFKRNQRKLEGSL